MCSVGNVCNPDCTVMCVCFQFSVVKALIRDTIHPLFFRLTRKSAGLSFWGMSTLHTFFPM